MKRLLGAVLLALVTLAGAASAQGKPAHEMSALGFHSVDAPLGVRWWLNPKVGIDAGIGLGSVEDPAVDENLSHWALDLGVPILLRSFDRLRFMVRPGILYRSEEVVVDPGPPVNKDNDTQLAINVELEAEVFLTDHFSVSAAQGLAFVNTDPAVGQSTTDWGTTGANFTNLGFHVYLFGSK
jgi:hypothetical protein